MMIAWYFAAALAKQYEAAVPYIEQRRLAPWTHNKTIRKAIESYRVTGGAQGLPPHADNTSENALKRYFASAFTGRRDFYIRKPRVRRMVQKSPKAMRQTKTPFALE